MARLVAFCRNDEPQRQRLNNGRLMTVQDLNKIMLSQPHYWPDAHPILHLMCSSDVGLRVILDRDDPQKRLEAEDCLCWTMVQMVRAVASNSSPTRPFIVRDMAEIGSWDYVENDADGPDLDDFGRRCRKHPGKIILNLYARFGLGPGEFCDGAGISEMNKQYPRFDSVSGPWDGSIARPL